jgi:Ca-activated chloride channel family protein
MNFNLHDFHFLRPWWLLALPLGLWLLHYKSRRRQATGAWQRVCDAHLLDHLLVKTEENRSRLPTIGRILMLLLAILALAGPTWQRRPQPLYHSAGGRVLVLDLSRSMDCPDLAPSRLTRARYRAIDLIQAGKGYEQGLVVFAGDAFVVAPLTDDRKTLLNLLPGLDTSTPPVPGSRADRGLEKAGRLLARAGVRQGQILLLADDADARTVAVAKKLRRAGHQVDVIAAGTAAGAPIPLADGGYLKDKNGRIVVPMPNFPALRQTAAAGGGRYLTLESPENAFAALNHLRQLFPQARGKSEALGDQWRDCGPWLLLPLLLLGALSFRRGWLLLLVGLLLGGAALPRPAQAFSWSDLWLRPDQQAARAFKQKDYPAAAQLAPDPDWQAAALYRQGKFQQAADLLQEATTPEGHYNRGNALAKAGKLKAALKEYEQALQANPDLADARANRELVKRLLEQQQKQPQQQKQGGGQQSQQQNKKQDEQQPGKDQTQKKGQNQKQKAQQQPDRQQKDPKGQDKQSQSQPSSSPADSRQGKPGQRQSANDATEPNHSAKTGRKQDERPPSDRLETEPKQSRAVPSEQKQEPQENQAEKQHASALKKRKPKDDANQPRQANTPVAATQDKPHPDVKQQALEQWLRRIPDDPGGLLRRKFRYQYQRRQDRSGDDKSW